MRFTDTLRNIFNWYVNQSQVVKAVITVCLTYVFIAAVFLTVRATIKGSSNDLMLPYNNSNTIIGNNINGAKIPVLGNDNYSKVLKLQEEVISLRRNHHYEVAITFFKNYYSVTVCLMIISCIGGLLLFVLINRGWAGSSYTLKVLFLAMASTAIFLSLFSGVFSQQKNFEENMLRFMDYTKAELKLSQQISELSKEDYPMIWKKHPSAPKDSTWVVDTIIYYRSLDTLVAKNNSTINSLTNYFFSIDATKMRNMSEVYGALLDLKNMGKSDSTRND